jgi:hypothetical protein
LSGRRRALLAAAILGALVVWYVVVDGLPNFELWVDVLITATILIPLVFGLVLLALPYRRTPGLIVLGALFVVLALLASWLDLDIVANFAKLAAATAVGFWFLELFERLSWVVLVAAIIPVVDSISVWRGPTNKIVTDQPFGLGGLPALPLLSLAFLLANADLLWRELRSHPARVST